MRLVHAADLHLDSPLTGLSRLGSSDAAREVAAELRLATRRALENLVSLVLEEDAAALLLAGDVYDGTWRDFATGRFFASQMGRLHDHGVPVVMVSGNHDAESEITRALILPPNVHQLDTGAPQTLVLDDLGLAVHGQGFATKAVTENLAAAYPHRVRGLVNVGLLHTAVEGAEGHAPYAPCTPADLVAPGYEYFALGHVHAHTVVAAGQHVAAFSGNLQGRHPRETGPKGALVVEVAAGGAAVLEHRPLDVARWASIAVDAGGARDREEVLARVQADLAEAQGAAQGRRLVARVTVGGATDAAADLARGDLLAEEVDAVAERLGVTVERVRSRAVLPARSSTLEPALVASVTARAVSLAADPDALTELAGGLNTEVGRALREAGLLDLGDGAVLADVAQRATEALLARLHGGVA